MKIFVKACDVRGAVSPKVTSKHIIDFIEKNYGKVTNVTGVDEAFEHGDYLHDRDVSFYMEMSEEEGNAAINALNGTRNVFPRADRMYVRRQD
jgi:hypothetical protein